MHKQTCLFAASRLDLLQARSIGPEKALEAIRQITRAAAAGIVVFIALPLVAGRAEHPARPVIIDTPYAESRGIYQHPLGALRRVLAAPVDQAPD